MSTKTTEQLHQPATSPDATTAETTTQTVAAQQPVASQQSVTSVIVPNDKKKQPNRKKRKIVGRIVWGVIILAVLAGLAFAVWKIFLTPKPVFYETAMVFRGNLENTAMGYGYVKAAETADIAVLQSGTVLESNVKTGDKVAVGDMLFKLDSSTLEKTIADLEDEVKKLQKANDELMETQQKAREDATVIAPFTGKYIAPEEPINVTIGDVMGPNARLGTLVDDSTMLLTLYYSYAYENDIKVGKQADISIPASMSVVSGKVNKIEKIKKISAEGTVLFEVEFAITNPGALAKDMMATAIMTTATGEEILPAEAQKLRYNKEQTLTMGTQGKVTAYNLYPYYVYNKGEVLATVDYTPETDMIETNNDNIIRKQEQIATERKKFDSLSKVAPIAGTIMYNKLVVGEKAEPGQAVISIAQLERMVIEAQIDERAIGGVTIGKTVTMTQWTDKGEQQFMGTVESVSMEAKTENGVTYFPAVIAADNYEGLLLSGMSVNYSVSLESRENVLVAPINAVKYTPVGEVVFLKTAEKPANAVEMPPEIPVPPGFFAVPVVTGLGTTQGIEIVEGIDEGAELYTQDLDYDPAVGPNPDGGGKPGMIRVG